MAGASIPVKYLDDITECPICTEVFTDTRMLPCTHTFCLKCISTWGKDKEPGDSLACPLCRKEVNVPAGGFNELQRNIFVEKLLDVKRLSSFQSSGDELCAVCDKATKMTMRCVDCQQSMCHECSASHKRERMTEAHKLVEISNQSERVNPIGKLKVSESFCDKHEDEKLKFYCFDCKLVVCAMCFVQSHQSHKCTDVKEVADELSGKMNADVKDLSAKIVECQNMLKQLTVVAEECVENANETEREIIARAKYMKQQIDETEDSLIQEVRSNKKVQDKKLEALKDELERQMMTMESFHRYSDVLLGKGTACDVVRAASDMQGRARELLQVNVSGLTNVESCQSKYTLVYSDPIEGLKYLFGHLDQGIATCTQTFAPAAGGFPTSIKPLHVIQSTGRRVGGVTSLYDEVFVVRCNPSQQVAVYDVNTMSLKRSLLVPDLGQTVVCGLVACPINSCLYVSDYNLKVVHRVAMTGSHNVTKLPVGNTPDGLSLNSSYNLLVAFYGKNKFQEYTTHGSLVREIKLQSNIENIAHVVQLSVTEFGVTYCAPQSCYSVIGVDGRVIRSYSNSGAGELKKPHCIAVNKRGFVFIADRGNNRIVVLHPQTLCSRVLPVDGGLDDPLDLWLDEPRDRLYIGEFNGMRVIVITGVNDIGL